MLHEECSAAGAATTKNQMMLDKINQQHAALLWNEIIYTIPGMLNLY